MTASTAHAATSVGRLGRLLAAAVRTATMRAPTALAPVALAQADVSSDTSPSTTRCYMTADVNGMPARVCEISDDTARVELSVPVDLDEVTLTLTRDGRTLTRAARVVSYRRHPDGPASYGLEFTTA